MGNQANPTDIGLGVATGGLWNQAKAGGDVLNNLSKTGGGEQVFADIPPALRPLWNQANQMIQGNVGLTLDPATYTMTPLQSSIQGAASNALASGGAYGNLNNYINQVLQPGFANPMNNPGVANVLQSAQDAFTQGLGKNLDMLQSTFGMSGQVPQRSGGFGQQATNLSRQALGDYGNNISGILFDQYNKNLQLQSQAANQTPMISSILNALSGPAGLPQQLAGAKQQGQLDLTNLPFQMILSLMGQTPLSYPSFAPQTPSMLQQIGGLLGGAGQAGQGIGAILGAF